MDLILIPLKPFAGHPVAVFGISAVFFVPCCLQVYSKRSKWTMATVAFVWFGYGIWETFMSSWRSSAGDMAIRIDLAIWGPMLWLAALIGLFVMALGYRRVD